MDVLPIAEIKFPGDRLVKGRVITYSCEQNGCVTVTLSYPTTYGTNAARPNRLNGDYIYTTHISNVFIIEQKKK